MDQYGRISAKVSLYEWSLANVVSLISVANHFGTLMKITVDNSLDVRVSVKSLVGISQQLMSRDS